MTKKIVSKLDQPTDIKSQNATLKAVELDNDFFDLENKNDEIEAKNDYDPKQLFTRSIETKRKPKVYSFIRVALIGLGLFIFIILSSLSIGYNLSEFENPDFVKHENSIQSINQRLLLPGQNSRESDLPVSGVINHIDQRKEANFINRITSLSFEFVIITSILTLLSYLIYRYTDWPFVKNKLLLVFLIILTSLIISLGFWFTFRQDNRIPAAMRIHRDNWRRKFVPRQSGNVDFRGDRSGETLTRIN